MDLLIIDDKLPNNKRLKHKLFKKIKNCLYNPSNTNKRISGNPKLFIYNISKYNNDELGYISNLINQTTNKTIERFWPNIIYMRHDKIYNKIDVWGYDKISADVIGNKIITLSEQYYFPKYSPNNISNGKFTTNSNNCNMEITSSISSSSFDISKLEIIGIEEKKNQNIDKTNKSIEEKKNQNIDKTKNQIIQPLKISPILSSNSSKKSSISWYNINDSGEIDWDNDLPFIPL